MLKFFKKFFEKEQPKPEKAELKLNEVESWLKQKTSKLEQDAINKIAKVVDVFNQRSSQIKNHADELNQAKLRNPNIHPKERQLMEGNRFAYIKKTTQFVDNLRLPDPLTSAEISSFISEWESLIDVLHKTTKRPYYILQEFFAHESRKIADDIAFLDKQVRQMKTHLDEANIGKIKQAFDLVEKINNKMGAQQERKQELEDKENQHKKTEQEKLLAQQQIVHLEKSPDYQEYTALLEKKEQLMKDIKEKRSEFVNVFGGLEHSLRKFERVTLQDKLISSYLEDPVKALLDDTELVFFYELEKLAQHVKESKLDLKDKKKEKTLAAINQLSKEFLTQYKDSIENSIKSRAEMEKEIMTNRISRDLKNEKYRFDHLQLKEKQMKEQVEALKKNLERFDYTDEKEELQGKLQSITNVEVSIV